MSEGELGSREDRPIVHPQLDDEDAGLQLFVEVPIFRPHHVGTGHGDDCGLIDMSEYPDSAEP